MEWHHLRVGTHPRWLHAGALDRDHARVPAALPGLLRLRRRSPGRRPHAARGARLQGPGTHRRRARAGRPPSSAARLDRRRRAAGALQGAEHAAAAAAEARHPRPARDQRRAGDPRGVARRFRSCRSSCPIDGLQPEHDVRRTPATYDRILKHIVGHPITVHCTVTRQQVNRPGYIEEFLRVLVGARGGREDLDQPLHAADRRDLGGTADARRSPAGRRRPDGAAAALSEAAMPEGLLDVYAAAAAVAGRMRRSRARRTSISADLTTKITPCQFGGTPDCSNCGCIASAGLAAVARHQLLGVIPVGSHLHRIAQGRRADAPSAPAGRSLSYNCWLRAKVPRSCMALRCCRGTSLSAGL